MRLILFFIFFSFTAAANVQDCKKFELTLEYQVLSKIYFLRTMSAQMQVSSGKATLLWDSGYETKKWKVDQEEGLILIKAKKLKKVFESYVDITSSARYVQLINFIEENEDEDDFRFSPMNEAAPFLGNNNFPSSIGEYRISYTYSDCQ